MLRLLLIVLGVAMVVFGVWFFRAAAAPLVIFGSLIILGTVFEQRYRPRVGSDDAWEPTGERFVDPATGKLVDVFYDPKSGERDYRSS